MTPNTLKLVLVLVFVIILAVIIKLINPHKKYSTQKFWETAAVEDVQEIPDEVLKPGNRNGGVLMWAAITTHDPEILSALVARGCDVNELDVFFKGSPLSGAAAYNSNPAIIDRLIELGAEINKTVGRNDKTPLIIAAELNPHSVVIQRLIHHGADIHYRDDTGRTAYEQAIRFENDQAIEALRQYQE